MGDVYRARDPRLNRDVTIKVSDGQIDLAADWFEKAIEERYSLVVMILQSAIGEPLRASPRWPKLAALMNLPEAES